MQYYYLNEDQTPIGPYSRDELIDKFSDQVIDKDTLVAEDGGNEWIKFITLLNDPTSNTVHINQSQFSSPNENKISYSLLNSFISTIICYTVLGTVAELSAIGAAGDDFSPIYFLALLSWGAATIFWAVLHHRCWNLLPHIYRNNVTPGKAVGYMFIPFYNLIWVSKSYGELEYGIVDWQKSVNGQSSLTPNLTQLPINLFISSYIIGIIAVFLSGDHPPNIRLFILSLVTVVILIMRCIFEIKMYREIKEAINNLAK